MQRKKNAQIRVMLGIKFDKLQIKKSKIFSFRFYKDFHTKGFAMHFIIKMRNFDVHNLSENIISYVDLILIIYFFMYKTTQLITFFCKLKTQKGLRNRARGGGRTFLIR